MGDKTHGFSIHGHRAVTQHAFGQVFFMKKYSHQNAL
jgi:hypothetical protein